jgi:hypothetical protein
VPDHVADPAFDLNDRAWRHVACRTAVGDAPF